MVYRAEVQPEMCEECGCTFVRKADEREVMDIVGGLLLRGEDSILLKEANYKKGMR